MKIALMLLCLCPVLVQAGNLYRCVGPAGQVSYQAAACAGGQRTDRIIEFVPVADSTPLSAERPKARAKWTNSRMATASRERLAKPRPTQSSRCARAKSKREQQLQRLGLKRTFDDLGRIDAAVRAVCNGY